MVLALVLVLALALVLALVLVLALAVALPPGGYSGAVLAGHRAEPALAGGRGIDEGVRAALAGADADAVRVVLGELVTQGQGRGGKQGIAGAGYPPGRAVAVAGVGEL